MRWVGSAGNSGSDEKYLMQTVKFLHLSAAFRRITFVQGVLVNAVVQACGSVLQFCSFHSQL